MSHYVPLFEKHCFFRRTTNSTTFYLYSHWNFSGRYRVQDRVRKRTRTLWVSEWVCWWECTVPIKFDIVRLGIILCVKTTAINLRKQKNKTQSNCMKIDRISKNWKKKQHTQWHFLCPLKNEKKAKGAQPLVWIRRYLRNKKIYIATENNEHRLK